ncbi:MAG: P27 family phage terminase small subunit [Bacteroidales bacterium]
MGILTSIKKDEHTTRFIRNITKQLKDKELYDESLDIAIYLTAVQLSIVIKISGEIFKEGSQPALIEHRSREGNVNLKRNPIFEELNKASDQARKLLRELGLTLDSAVNGTGDDPVDDLVDRVEGV